MLLDTEDNFIQTASGRTIGKDPLAAAIVSLMTFLVVSTLLVNALGWMVMRTTDGFQNQLLDYIVANLFLLGYARGACCTTLATVNTWLLRRWTLGEAICEAWLGFQQASECLSAWLILGLVADRWLYFRHRSLYRCCGRKQRFVVLACAWFFCLAISLPVFLSFGLPAAADARIPGLPHIKICRMPENLSYAIYWAAFALLTPMALSLLFYIRLVVVVRKKLLFEVQDVRTNTSEPIVDRRASSGLEPIAIHRLEPRNSADDTIPNKESGVDILPQKWWQMKTTVIRNTLSPLDHHVNGGKLGGSFRKSQNPRLSLDLLFPSQRNDIHLNELRTHTKIKKNAVNFQVRQGFGEIKRQKKQSGNSEDEEAVSSNGSPDQRQEFGFEARIFSHNPQLLPNVAEIEPPEDIVRNVSRNNHLQHMESHALPSTEKGDAKKYDGYIDDEDYDGSDGSDDDDDDDNDDDQQEDDDEAKDDKGDTTGGVDHANYETLKRLAIIIATYCVCRLPLYVSYLLMTSCNGCSVTSAIHDALLVLSQLNDAINPITYMMTSSRFRTAARLILRRKSPNSEVSSWVETRS